MIKLTKKSIFNLLDGKKVLKQAVNCFTEDQNEELKQSIINSLKDNNCTIEDFEEDENKYSMRGYSDCWRKSKLKKEEEGIIKFRSNDYIFIKEDNGNCYGYIPKMDNIILLENGFVNVLKWINKEKNEYQGIKYTLKTTEV